MAFGWSLATCRKAALTSLLLAVLPLMALGIRDARAATSPRFEFSDCWFKVPRDREMVCGHLVVPENRAALGENGDGPDIRIAVVIFVPDRERHEPVLYLSGGPGQAAHIADETDIADWWRYVDQEPWLRGRQLVVIDQRGVGLSQPALDCADVFRADIWNRRIATPRERPDFDAAEIADIRACRERLAARGIDLSAYTTEAIAADARDLRRALGIARWVVYGISYGTEAGLALVDVDREGLEALILDSVLPPEVPYLHQDAANLAHALALLDADCAKDAECRRDGPTLAAMVESVVRDFTAEPLLLRLPEAEKGQPSYTRVTGEDFLETLFDQFYDRPGIEALPRLIRATYAQDYRPLADALEQNTAYGPGNDITDGMGFSVVCSEQDTMVPADGGSAAPVWLADWAENTIYRRACPLWLPGYASRPLPAAASADIPVLMLSGDYDPVTPAGWAAAAAKRFARGKAIVFRGIGHDVVDSDPCGGEVVADFLADPDARIGTPCLAQLEPPAFQPDDGGKRPLPAQPAGDDIMVSLPAGAR